MKLIPSTVENRFNKIKKNINRAFFIRKIRKLVAPKDYCYISQNCLGGKFYQIERRQYTSPTIGLWFESSDFLKLCKNFKQYLRQELLHDECESIKMGYPVGILDDIKIYFLHYKTFQSAKVAWGRRVERVNLEKIFFIMTDRDGYSEGNLDKFNQLPTNKKILFMHKKIACDDNVIYVPGYDEDGCVGDLVGDFNRLVTKKISNKLIKLLLK
jgi:uncharacterized protein (DUF1919 family)